jgi:hypothetical protein
MNRTDSANTPDAAWAPLCRIGGVAALAAVVLTLGDVIVLAAFPPPGTIREWFALFQTNPFIALLDFWGLEVPMYAMYALVFLALFVVLRKADESRMAIVKTLALLGVGIFLATNNPFSMLSLSNQHAAAATEAEKSAYLAAGQTLLVNTGQRAIGGFNTGLFLVSIAGLIVSTVMLGSGTFSRATAWVGIFAHTLSLADSLRQAITASEIILLLVVLPNALLLVIWYAMVGRSLLRLGRAGAMPSSGQPKPETSRRTAR